MLKAVKENKEYTITSEQKARYLNEGFDIHDESGKIVEYSPKKKIEYNKHVQLIAEKDKEILELKDTVKGLEKEVEELKATLNSDNKNKGGKKE